MIKKIRMCIGCRESVERSSLLRIVCANGAFVCDERANLPGRGSWVHNRFDCLQLAIKKGAFFRALRVSQYTDTTHIENRLKLIMDRL